MALDGALDGGIVLAIQGGGMAPPALHAPTHQNGGTDVLTSHATTAANLVWASPASGAAAGPSFRALAMADVPTKARTEHIQCEVPGVLPGIAAAYATPGTAPSGGAGAATALRIFWVPGVGPASTWLLQGCLGQLGIAPGGIDELTVTVLKSTGGGAYADTLNTFTFGPADTEAFDDSNAISFASGDKLAVRVDGGGASADLSLILVLLRQS